MMPVPRRGVRGVRPPPLTVAVGTRPEVIKLAAGGRARCARPDTQVRCVATGQHSDPLLSADLFAELGCAARRRVGAGRHRGRRGSASCSPMPIVDLDAHRPDAVLVLGDTYTAPLVAMAAPPRRCRRRAPRGRAAVVQRAVDGGDQPADGRGAGHAAPGADRDGRGRSCVDEGVPADRIRVVGNPVLDALVATGVRRRAARRARRRAAHRAPGDQRRRPGPAGRAGRGRRGLAATGRPRCCSRCTRAPATGSSAAGLLAELAALPGRPSSSSRCPTPRCSRALAGAPVVVTDSGGLQEEASYLGVPVVVHALDDPALGRGARPARRCSCGLDADRGARRPSTGSTTPAELAGSRRCPARTATGTPAHAVVAALADPDLRDAARRRATRSC